MRVIAGLYKGRRLDTPKSDAIRPTSDKVRGAIFNMLLAHIDLNDAHVLDAFCGTAALGLEALSRGAKHCTFIDVSRNSLNLAQHNIETLSVDKARYSLLQKDVTQYHFKDTLAFDLVFLDPPYAQGLVEKTLNSLHNAGILKDGAIVVAEDAKDESCVLHSNFQILKEKEYGQTVIRLLRYQAEP